MLTRVFAFPEKPLQLSLIDMTSALDPNAVTAITAILLVQFQQQVEALTRFPLSLPLKISRLTVRLGYASVYRDYHAQLLITAPVDSANQVYLVVLKVRMYAVTTWTTNY